MVSSYNSHLVRICSKNLYNAWDILGYQMHRLKENHHMILVLIPEPNALVYVSSVIMQWVVIYIDTPFPPFFVLHLLYKMLF